MANLDARETLMLELNNRARMDPLGEAARYGVADLTSGGGPSGATAAGGTITATPKKILVWNPLLSDAATAHSNWMNDNDVFAHNQPGPVTPTMRMQAAGYSTSGYWGTGENLAWSGSSLESAYDANAETLAQHQNLFLSGGHRSNILANDFREVGIASELGYFLQGGTNYYGMMTTLNFAYTAATFPGGTLTYTTHFVGGVSYNDTVLNNDFYSIGEGVGGRTVELYNGATLLASTTSQAAGAYTLSTSFAGNAEIVFSGAGLAAAQGASFATGSGNAKVDIVDNSTIESNTTTTLTRSTDNLRLLGIENIAGTGNARSNILNGNAGNNSLNGGLGNDSLYGLDGSDTLTGGAGNDTIEGGNGTDSAVFENALSFYIITKTASTYTLYGNDGSVDIVTGVESFQFSDGARLADNLPLAASAPVRSASISAVTSSANEGNSGTTAFTFNVVLNAAAYNTISVNYTVAGSGGTPANASDFSSTLT